MSEGTGSLTATKYELKLTPDFGDYNLAANLKIHVNVVGEVENFNLQVGDNLNVTQVIFWKAATIFRGIPDLYGQECTFIYDNDTEMLSVTPTNKVTPESIKAGGFVEIKYHTVIREKNQSKGIYRIHEALFETDLKNGSAKNLVPILGDPDEPVFFKLSVITPYRAGVKTELTAGEHRGVKVGEESLFANNFNSGDEKIKLSDVHFKIHGPIALVLD